MAQFVTRCPHCRNKLEVLEEWIGKTAECPACKKRFEITAPEEDIVVPKLLEEQTSLYKSNKVVKQPENKNDIFFPKSNPGILPTDMTAVPGSAMPGSPRKSALKKKKVIITLSIIIAVLLVGGIMTVTAKHFAEEKRFAEELKPAQALGIQFSDDGKKLIKCPNDVKEVVIPSCVTTIGDEAFRGCENLQSVTIPDSVTYIGNLAFLWCTNLQSVTIPDSVTSIGEAAFAGVKSVKVADGNPNFYVDDSGVLIDRKNKKLLYCPPSISGNYIIPVSVTSIGDGAFSRCYNLLSVTIPDSVT